MKDRFTHKSRIGRGNIPRAVRREVYTRDNYTCQFCGLRLHASELTIDHLLPVSRGGLDEITNYVTSCKTCNERKASTPLRKFAESLDIAITDLPVHGDPVIDNQDLPIQIRLLRKRIFNKSRRSTTGITGRGAQKRLERLYRRELWQTPAGKALEREFTSLPGQVRAMIPEIKALAQTEREFWLLVELAKSANTRNLIGTALIAECDIEERCRSLRDKARNQALKKRMEQALGRFEKLVRIKGL